MLSIDLLLKFKFLDLLFNEIKVMNIVITGSGKGIGKALAEKFSGKGNQLFICARSDNDLAKVATGIVKKEPDAIIKYLAVDLSEKRGVTKFANWLTSQNIIPEILINNAGQFIPGSVHNEEEGTLERMIEVNLYSAYHLTRAFLATIETRG
jgi:short-subunit dehydrogenase